MVQEQLTKNDLVILAHLRQNARKKLTQISRAAGIPVSTLYDRMEALKRVAILHFACRVNFAQLGFPICATIVLKSHKQKREGLEQFLQRHQHVDTIRKINNSYDFLLETVFSTFKELEDFLVMLQDEFGIQRYEVFHHIEELKSNGFLADPTTAFLLYPQRLTGMQTPGL